MYLLDTNIFLEVLLDQERADECVILLELISFDTDFDRAGLRRLEPRDVIRLEKEQK
jgi:predicted nucleic acid-binding protein